MVSDHIRNNSKTSKNTNTLVSQ